MGDIYTKVPHAKYMQTVRNCKALTEENSNLKKEIASLKKEIASLKAKKDKGGNK